MILPYIKYFLKAGNEHSLHSPFLFDLYRFDIAPKEDQHADYARLAQVRKEMLQRTDTIEILDLGAGSRVNKSNIRPIRQIAKNAEKPAKFGRLFHRLVRRFQPKTVLELGTSLGITTLYFAKASETVKVTTFEGCPETARIAQENFQKIGATNIDIVVGNIDQTLRPVLEKLEGPLDLLYVDANHRYEPTIRYFKECLPYVHNDSLMIFDDIYWSDEMTQAWEEIKNHPEVTVTVDLFWIGLVFFRKEQVKEHFTLRF